MKQTPTKLILGLAIGAVLLLASVACADESITLNGKDTGYRGIWYMNQPSGDEYVYKYSGGLGTYCAKHKPLAVYRRQRTKSYIRPPALECTPCILCIVARRTRPQAIAIQSVLLGQSRQRPNPAPTNERIHDETGNIRPVHRIIGSDYGDRS